MYMGLGRLVLFGRQRCFTACIICQPREGGAFFTGNRGELHGESSQGSITPPFSSSSTIGLIPFLASGFNGYCLCLGGNSDLGLMTTGGTSLIRPTSAAPFDHRSSGTFFSPSSSSSVRVNCHVVCFVVVTCTFGVTEVVQFNVFLVRPVALLSSLSPLLCQPVTCWALWVNRPSVFH